MQRCRVKVGHFIELKARGGVGVSKVGPQAREMIARKNGASVGG
jgi:hypothetical protein